MRELVETVCGTTDPLRLLLRAGSVLRYHAEGVGIVQDVAAHTWRVAVILLHLWPDASRELVLAALYHDAAEGLVGDLPAPVKRDPAIHEAISRLEREFEAFLGVPSEANLSPEDYARLKCADCLELCLTCADHPRATVALRNGRRYARETATRLPADERERVEFLLSRIGSRE